MLKKNNIAAGIHNASAEYAKKMIDIGFNLVTIGSDQKALTIGAKSEISKIKKIDQKETSKTY